MTYFEQKQTIIAKKFSTQKLDLISASLLRLTCDKTLSLFIPNLTKTFIFSNIKYYIKGLKFTSYKLSVNIIIKNRNCAIPKNEIYKAYPFVKM